MSSISSRGERHGMWISKFFEFSSGGYFIPSFVIPGQQVTSDPCLDPLGLLYTPIRALLPPNMKSQSTETKSSL
ncbi:hypothetical protein F2P79_011639 [Pimephales promelas]|nr:hypothetical protein F2P79_011639 [Pimephales promelas]